MKPTRWVYAVACLLNLAACTQSDTDEITPASGQALAGYATGKAVDQQGNPIKGAEIVANNTGTYSNNSVGYTDAQGNYKIKLPSGPLIGSFYIRGTIKVKYDGQNFTLPLFTQEDGAFAPEGGAVKNLVLRMAGERTGKGYYGGQVEVENWTKSVSFSDIELTLKPAGSLMDGSTGKIITTALNGNYVDDVPLGKYTISARQRSTQKPLAVRIRNKGQEYGQSAVGKFEPAYEGAQRFHMMVQLTDM